MLKHLRAGLLLVTAFWLPIQTVTAFIMPLGLLSAPAHAAAVPSASEVTMPCHSHAIAADVGPVQDAVDGTASTPSDTCRQCGVCHLACAGYVPANPLSGVLLPASPVQVAAAVHYLPSRATPPPHHPPRV